MTRAMKDSGIEWIGQIPENWKISKLFYQLDAVGSGTTPQGEEYYDGNIPWLNTGDLTDENVEYAKKTINSKAMKDYSTLKLYPKDSIVIAMYGATIGKLGILKTQMTTNQACCVMSVSHKNYHKFIFYNFYAGKTYLLSTAAGAGQPNINQNIVKSFIIPLPHFSEQQKIADYLDKRCEKIDTAIDNQKQIIEKLKEYKQSLITETVTKGLNPNVKLKDSGIEWIGSIPEHWQDIKLKFNSYIRARLGWKGLKAEEYVEQGYPLLSAFNIINNKLVFEDLKFINQMRYDESPEIKLQKDDILLVKDGAGIGKCALVTNLPFPSTVNGSIAVVTTNKNLTSKFLYYYFLSKLFQAYIERLKDGMGVPHLFQSDLKEICIVSPNKLEQKEITEYLDKKCNQIDEAIKQKEETINKLEEYKKSLIFECVTGKKEVA